MNDVPESIKQLGHWYTRVREAAERETFDREVVAELLDIVAQKAIELSQHLRGVRVEQAAGGAILNVSGPDRVA